jgi:phosphatidylserine/phosphatidylglycerophosphate/cardiolipin synthase-like enzyme
MGRPTAAAIALLAATVGPVAALAPAAASTPLPAATSTVAPVLQEVPQPAAGLRLLTNNPVGSKADKRALLEAFIRLVNSQQRRDRIRIVTYQIHDDRVVDALVAAHRRGVGVQIVMDRDRFVKGKHEQRLRTVLGGSTGSRSFIVTPYSQTVHTKMALFSRGGQVLVGSSNLTNWRHWNHVVEITDGDLHAAVVPWFRTLSRGEGGRYTRIVEGAVRLHLFPGRADPVKRAIDSSAGDAISIQMFTWGKTRGQIISDSLVAAMSRGTTVLANTGVPWSSAVTTVNAAGGDVFNTRNVTSGKAYPHDKLIVVDDDVYTGSDNWKHFHAKHFEVVAHIADAGLAAQLRQYVLRTREQAAAIGATTSRDVTSLPLAVQVSAGENSADVSWSFSDPARVTEEVLVTARAWRTGADGVSREVATATRVVAPAEATDPTVQPFLLTLDRLAAGVTHRVTVSAHTQQAVTRPQAFTVVPMQPQPLPPENLVVAPVSPTAATVRYEPATSASLPAGYLVSHSTDRGATWVATSTTKTSLRLGSLPTGQRTLVKVQAVPASGLPSDFSRTRSVLPTLWPSRPTITRLVPLDASRLRVAWADPTNTGASAINRWVLRYRVGDSETTQRKVVRRPDANRARIGGLPPGAEVTVVVRAGNSHGLSAASRAATEQLPDTP